MHFVLSLGEGMLREGVSFGVADDVPAGVRVKLLDADMHVDFTESAVSQFLLRHMIPRFRALLRGAAAADTSPLKPPKLPRK
jgi:V/A-type H+-transporting ATPase subunit E